MTDEKQVQVKGKKHHIAEVAGGTAAECAAVCCCPCAVVHFAAMALYTIPKGLVKKAVIKIKKRDRALEDGTTATTTNNNNNIVVMIEGEKESADTVAVTTALEEKESTDSVVALDKEMWARFAGTGFWRSQSRSQRDP